MRLTDSSLGNRTEMNGQMTTLEVKFFSRNVQNLPRIRGSGDIIRLLAAQLVEFNGRPQLIAKVPFRCHFSLFSPDNDFRIAQTLMPYQRTVANFTITQADKDKMADLNIFFKDNVHLFFQAGKPISKLAPETFADISGKIVAVEDKNTEYQVIYLWDGTDAPFLDASEDWGGFGLEKTEADEKIVRRLPLVTQQDLLAPPSSPPQSQTDSQGGLPEIGSYLPVNLFKPLRNEDRSPATKKFRISPGDISLPAMPEVGDWVRIRNIKIIAVKGQLQALYLRTSKWQPIHGLRTPPEDFESDFDSGCQRAKVSLRRRRENNEVAEDVSECLKEAELLTECKDVSMRMARYYTLREIMAYEGPWQDSGGISFQSFKCLVRLVDYAPQDTTCFCRKLPSGKYSFVVKLHLQDATAELDAMLLDAEASGFFSGCPQVNLKEAKDFAIALKQAMTALCLPREQSSGFFWMEVCIRKILVNNGGEIGQALYRVVGTEFSTGLTNVLSRVSGV